MLEALAKLQEEDPTLRLEEDPETGQRVLRGMGELHLQITFERLEREFNLKVRAGKPAVVVRETIAGPGEAHALFHRVIEQGETRLEMKAGAQVAVRPLERGAGLSWTVEPEVLPEGATLSAAQLEAAEAGARDATTSGPAEGAPLQDVAVEVRRIELFGEASSPQAIRVAVAEAVRKALTQAGPLVLQPIMTTEVVVPEENLGTVLGDLQARGAVIHGTETELGTTSIRCEAPLGKLLGYTTDLRSMTRGRGQFTMEFNRFDVL